MPVEYANRELYAWRVLLKTREAVGAMLISAGPWLGPELYRGRWRVELVFRSAKELMPPCRLRSLEGRLLLFAIALLAAVLAELFGGLPALRRRLGRMLYPGWAALCLGGLRLLGPLSGSLGSWGLFRLFVYRLFILLNVYFASCFYAS